MGRQTLKLALLGVDLKTRLEHHYISLGSLMAMLLVCLASRLYRP